MASINKYRDLWLKAHKTYENEALKVLFRVFGVWGSSIDWDLMNENNYKSVIEFNIDESLMFDAYLKIYTGVGLAHGKRVGESINLQLKAFVFDDFSTVFKDSILSWIRGNVGQNIILVRRTYIDFINKIISDDLASGDTMDEITDKLMRLVKRKSFYRYQAQRIARTETTTAANYAASVSSTVSGFVMQKMWISILDARTRRPPESHFNHVVMNEKRVGQYEMFDVNGDMLRFPGDPNGQAGNIINCRCGVAIVPARDSQGDLIEI